MAAFRDRVSRLSTDSPGSSDPAIPLLSDFYREELLKCQRCLEAQREYYSERAISDVQRALTKVISQLDRLCVKADSDEVVGRLLRQFDVVARLSRWTDPRQVH